MPAIQLMTVSSTETKPSAESAGVKSQKLSGLQGTFSNYMRQNSSNTAQTAKGQNAVLQTKPAGNDTNVKEQYEQYQNKAAVQTDKTAGNTGTGQTDTQTVQETVEEAVENIKEVIKENLGVDDEQIEAAMELLGLTQADLLNPQPAGSGTVRTAVLHLCRCLPSSRFPVKLCPAVLKPVQYRKDSAAYNWKMNSVFPASLMIACLPAS